MKSSEIREKFLNYFKEHGHTIVASSSLIPGNDSTLLFTNAGMVQFKDVFLGEKRAYNRATSSQRCVRAGGKHNDLENVGYTARHHTFFEMLGNFSFGDYFKREAIGFAWRFLTEELKLPKEKLWVTVFVDDQETADIWINDFNIDPKRLSRCGEKDNFWSMGDTGPCGPCTEIFYDHGPEIPGGPPGSPDEDGDRYIEIWNLVFMQYNRDASGKLTPLPKPSVDTGMGLERISAVMQSVHSNYEIDIFANLIKDIAAITHTKDLTHISLRVIADHIRSTSFLIVDGVRPSNEGRGYVLRRIIRRAVRHGNQLGMREPFFYRVTQSLVKQMGEAYPELAKAQSTIERVLKQEEEQFARTLDQGLNVLEDSLKKISGNEIPGEIIFKLYDTYGFPVDLTGDIARERQMTLDIQGFERLMQEQRTKAQAASQFGTQALLTSDAHTEFTGYHTLSEFTKIHELFVDGNPVEKIHAGQSAAVILTQTPFYAESGGQVGDVGELVCKHGLFKVIDTQKSAHAIIHHGTLIEGALSVGDALQAVVDLNKRKATALNHSATHLLHAALKQILGEHVMQKGSLVTPERLRFDFTHFEPMTSAQIIQAENLVNEKIRENARAEIKVMNTEDALQSGATALFGEKYGENVRVLNMNEGFSIELCGGTHVESSGEIGLFKIVSESGSAAGVRRIEALTGQGALDFCQEQIYNLQTTSQLLKTNPQELLTKVQQLLDKNKTLEKQAQQFSAQLSKSQAGDLLQNVQELNGFKVLTSIQNDAKILRDQIDDLKSREPLIVVCLAAIENEKITLAAGVGKKAQDKISAVDLVNHIAAQLGGKGGGRADFAQAGAQGSKAQLEQALESATAWLKGI
ncbi:MAG: alanine--tRNA ligase [Legionellales bacterium]|jgi:alanyl-tRNA synthetase